MPFVGKRKPHPDFPGVWIVPGGLLEDADGGLPGRDLVPDVGPLANKRREAFARELAKGLPMREAFTRAGYCYSPRNGGANAWRILEGDRRVRQRAVTLRRRAIAKADVDHGYLIERARTAVDMAEQERNPGQMVSAIKELGTLAGIREERRAVTSEHTVSVEGDTIERALLAFLGRAAGPRGGVIEHDDAELVDVPAPAIPADFPPSDD